MKSNYTINSKRQLCSNRRSWHMENQGFSPKIQLPRQLFSPSAIFWWKSLTGFCVHLSKAVVAHFVHKAIEQHWRAFPIHAELSCWCVVIMLLYVLASVRAPTNSYHPQKLVDIYGKLKQHERLHQVVNIAEQNTVRMLTMPIGGLVRWGKIKMQLATNHKLWVEGEELQIPQSWLPKTVYDNAGLIAFRYKRNMS